MDAHDIAQKQVGRVQVDRPVQPALEAGRRSLDPRCCHMLSRLRPQSCGIKLGEICPVGTAALLHGSHLVLPHHIHREHLRGQDVGSRVFEPPTVPRHRDRQDRWMGADPVEKGKGRQVVDAVR